MSYAQYISRIARVELRGADDQRHKDSERTLSEKTLK